MSEWQKKAPSVFYHGTSIDKFYKIMKEGLNPDARKREIWGNGTPRGIYLTRDIENAKYFAYDKKKIIKVKIPDKKFLRPDPYNTWSLSDELSYESVRYMKKIFPKYLEEVK